MRFAFGFSVCRAQALPFGEGGPLAVGEVYIYLFRHGLRRATFPKGEGFCPPNPNLASSLLHANPPHFRGIFALKNTIFPVILVIFTPLFL